jgi:hypothetical protein
MKEELFKNLGGGVPKFALQILGLKVFQKVFLQCL